MAMHELRPGGVAVTGVWVRASMPSSSGRRRSLFVDGKIVSEFVSFDSAEMMRQLQREDISTATASVE